MRKALFLGASALALGFGFGGFSSSAEAGNILLTGHDNDLHCYFGNAGNACGASGAEVSYVKAGSSLPVLAIDDLTSGRQELDSALTTLGVAHTTVTVGAVTAGMFNHSLYSAFAVASVTTCGGCDNPVGTGTHLAAFSSAIISFFNAGGGILGLAGATDPNAYAYIPDSAGNPTPIFASSGFVTTPAGTTIPGFFAVNGDETHNTFDNPGTGGVSPVIIVAERFGGTASSDPAVTLFVSRHDPLHRASLHHRAGVGTARPALAGRRPVRAGGCKAEIPRLKTGTNSLQGGTKMVPPFAFAVKGELGIGKEARSSAGFPPARTLANRGLGGGAGRATPVTV